MNADKYFTLEEQEKIQQAVVAAEQRTSGEIVPMIVSASSRYAEIDLTCLIVGLLAGTAAALLWGNPWGLTQTELALPVIGSALGLLLCRLPPLKRLLIPGSRVAEAVHLRGLAAFTAHGLHYTKAHTGILIFVSLFERRVVVLADKGINEKVPPGTWDEIVRIIASGLKSGQGCAAFSAAIEECGKILAEHFPRAPDDQDELKNKLVTEN
ncbi:MAG TPA: TPM domain-containing protein [Candidatus Binatia bacterium]|jgi:putative membrane protein